LPITTEVNLLKVKAFSTIVVTELGIVTSFNSLFPKAP
jgi:hypothetical protein